MGKFSFWFRRTYCPRQEHFIFGEGWGILNAVHAERRGVATQKWLEEANN
jgi:hypothetical protein